MNVSTIVALIKMAYAYACSYARTSGYDMPFALTLALIATFLISWVMIVVFDCLFSFSKAGLLGISAYWILQWRGGRLEGQTLDTLLEGIDGRRPSLTDLAHSIALASQAQRIEQQTNAQATVGDGADPDTSRLEEEMLKQIMD